MSCAGTFTGMGISASRLPEDRRIAMVQERSRSTCALLEHLHRALDVHPVVSPLFRVGTHVHRTDGSIEGHRGRRRAEAGEEVRGRVGGQPAGFGEALDLRLETVLLPVGVVDPAAGSEDIGQGAAGENGLVGVRAASPQGNGLPGVGRGAGIGGIGDAVPVAVGREVGLPHGEGQRGALGRDVEEGEPRPPERRPEGPLVDAGSELDAEGDLDRHAGQDLVHRQGDELLPVARRDLGDATRGRRHEVEPGERLPRRGGEDLHRLHPDEGRVLRAGVEGEVGPRSGNPECRGESAGEEDGGSRTAIGNQRLDRVADVLDVMVPAVGAEPGVIEEPGDPRFEPSAGEDDRDGEHPRPPPPGIHESTPSPGCGAGGRFRGRHGDTSLVRPW